MITFASGWLCGAVIFALGIPTFLEPRFHPEGEGLLLIVGTALIFLLGAAGQFIAALRHPWTYAAAFGCTALSVLLMAAMTGDRAADCLPDWAPRPWANPMLYVGASLTMAAASVLVAIFLGFGRNSATRANPRS